MGYLHIPNLYKAEEILEFKKVYALEKIHGTSAHISYKSMILETLPTISHRDIPPEQRISFHSGGLRHKTFIALFNKEELLEKFETIGRTPITIYGEAYGGKLMGMKDTYGDIPKFIAFDVKIGHVWLSVPQAEEVVKRLGLEFVSYHLVATTLELLDEARDAPSVQARRNGCGIKQREGIVLRPPFEVRKNNNERVIAKYKTENFRETKTPRPVSADKKRVLIQAQEIANEWVTEMRLTHVLDKLPTDDEGNHDIAQMKTVLDAMYEDITREAYGEIVMSKEAHSAINKQTAIMFKQRLKSQFQEKANK